MMMSLSSSSTGGGVQEDSEGPDFGERMELAACSRRLISLWGRGSFTVNWWRSNEATSHSEV